MRWMRPSAPGWPTGYARCITVASSRWTPRRCRARAVQATRCTCWQRWTTTTAPCSPSARCPPPPTRSPSSSRCLTAWTSPAWSSRPTHCTPNTDHASFLVDRGADYLLVVKANQPSLHAQLAELPWRQIPAMDRTRDHGHGRIEVRTLKVAAVAGLCFPHAAQAIQLIRRVRAPGSRRWRTVTVYAVPSLALGSASPAQLAGWLGGHWRIENQLHWVRDVDFGEDASTARSGSLPRVMASLRNLAVGALRLAGHPNLAAALRHTGRDPTRPLPSSTWHTDETDITAL